MHINSCPLPFSFLRDIKSGILEIKQGSIQLKEDIDFYGNELETELGQVFLTKSEIDENSKKLPTNFIPDGVYGEADETEIVGHVLPDIIDFREIVNFAISSCGSPFCFDFRFNQSQPSVIWWDDISWRIIAPSYEGFIALFCTDS